MVRVLSIHKFPKTVASAVGDHLLKLGALLIFTSSKRSLPLFTKGGGDGILLRNMKMVDRSYFVEKIKPGRLKRQWWWSQF